MKNVQHYERQSRLGQSWEALPDRARLYLRRTARTRLIWDLLASVERSLRGTHRLGHQKKWRGAAKTRVHGTDVDRGTLDEIQCLADTGARE